MSSVECRMSNVESVSRVAHNPSDDEPPSDAKCRIGNSWLTNSTHLSVEWTTPLEYSGCEQPSARINTKIRHRSGDPVCILHSTLNSTLKFMAVRILMGQN